MNIYETLLKGESYCSTIQNWCNCTYSWCNFGLFSCKASRIFNFNKKIRNSIKLKKNIFKFSSKTQYMYVCTLRT